ncbi:FCD domain-containing protein [Nocardioides sp.]|uniref:FadR/GntR family transcriptional regulator n=1 Tax=Nocardioides sp. TaxID=35761 RepID=UPI002622666E|nr:FCD domain-containing protein [Nocardioides sp.]
MGRVEHATEALERLLAGRTPGERIGSKADLVAEIGVAPGTINQAIRLLQERGLIDLRPGPGGGVFAARPNALEKLASAALSIGSPRSLFEDSVRLRRALDPVFLDDVITHTTPAHGARIHAILHDLKEAAARNDGTAFSACSWDYQVAIYDVSAFEFSRAVLMAAIRIQRDAYPRIWANEGDLDVLYAHHEELWLAIERGDREAALEVMREAMTRELAAAAQLDRTAAG